MRFEFGPSDEGRRFSNHQVMSNYPVPDFDAATEKVSFDDLSDGVATGADPQVHIEAVKKEDSIASLGRRGDSATLISGARLSPRV